MQKEHEQHIQAFTTWQYNVAATKYKVQEKIKGLHKVQEKIKEQHKVQKEILGGYSTKSCP